MALNLKSSGGGSVTVDVPSTASNYTATLPAGTGNVVVNGINSAITAGANTTASGTNVDFAIPSWVKRITVMYNGASLSGTSNPVIRVGTAGGVVATGYNCNSGSVSSTPAVSYFNFTVGFGCPSSSASNNVYGSYVLVNPTGNIWICSGTAYHNNANISWTAGEVDAGGLLTTIRCTNNGSDTWDAGSINVYWE